MRAKLIESARQEGDNKGPEPFIMPDLEDLLHFPRNRHHRALHSGVKVEYTKAKGRHIIATTDIEAGTVIGYDTPVVI